MSAGVGTVDAGELAVKYGPKAPKGTPRAGVLHGHGAGGDATSAISNYGLQGAIARRLAMLGCVGLSTDLGGEQTWANNTAMARMTSGYNYLTATMGAPSPVVLAGGSMGGLNVLAWAAANRSKVSCVVAQLPVLNVTDIHTNNRGGLTSTINTAWSPSGWSEAANGATRNPTTLAAAGAFAGLPILLFYGDSDTLCTPAQVAAFAASVPTCQTISVPGDHAETTLRKVATDYAGTIASFVSAHI